MVKDLGSETLSRQSDILWKRIAGTGDILAHQYLGVDMKLVWNIVEEHLPNLEKAIKEMAGQEGINLESP